MRKPRTVRMRQKGSEARKDVRPCNVVLINLVTGSQVAAAAKKHSRSITRYVHSALRISLGSFQGKSYFRAILTREKEESNLSDIMSSYLLLLIVCVSLYRKLTPLLFQNASPSPSVVMPRSWGVGGTRTSKPGSWGVGGTRTVRKRRMQSRKFEKHMEFLPDIPLKDSMRQSDIVWQHCGEKLREGWEWMYGDQLGSCCSGPEENRSCL